MNKDKALKLALEAVEWIAKQRTGGMIQCKATEAITAIRQALAAPVQEPVAWNKPTDAMVEAATNEYDEWSKDNQGTTECIRAMLVKAMKAAPPAAQPAPVQEPVAWTDEQMLKMWHEEHDAHKKTSSFAWYKAGLKAANKTTPPAAQPAVPLTEEKKYRLLEHGEKIEKGDTILGDDTETWHPLAGWEVGSQWSRGFMMPMRRAIVANPEKGGAA